MAPQNDFYLRGFISAAPSNYTLKVVFLFLSKNLNFKNTKIKSIVATKTITYTFGPLNNVVHQVAEICKSHTLSENKAITFDQEMVISVNLVSHLYVELMIDGW